MSHATERFRKLLAQLPKKIQKQAKEAYPQFEKDPYHPGLRIKPVHSKRPIFEVRISRNCNDPHKSIPNFLFFVVEYLNDGFSC